MTPEQKPCCEKCRLAGYSYSELGQCHTPNCPCHKPTPSSLIEQEKEIYAKWKAEHGDVAHENNPTSAEWYVRNYVETRLLPYLNKMI